MLLRALGFSAVGGMTWSCGVAPWAFSDGPGADGDATAQSQEGPAFRWSAAPVSVPAGGTGSLQVELSVPDGFKVRRGDIQLQVKDGHGLKFGLVTLPAAEPTHDDADIDVHYSGRVALTVPVSAVEGASGLFPVTLEGEVHGCAAHRCLGASRTPIEAIVHIVTPDAVQPPATLVGAP